MSSENKKSTITLSLAIAIFLIGALLFSSGCSSTANSGTETTPRLYSISYTHQEPEVGDSTIYVLTRTSDATATLNVRHHPASGAHRNIGETFDIDGSSMDKIDEICTKYDIYNWGDKIQKDNLEYLDAEEKIFALTLDDGNSILFSNLDELPKDADKAISELSDAIESLVDIN